MSQLTEIRWHARAGQGAVTAAKLVADTALLQGNYIQAMPEYGPERTGAPLRRIRVYPVIPSRFTTTFRIPTSLSSWMTPCWLLQT